MINQIIPTILFAVIAVSTVNVLRSLFMEPGQLKRFFIRMSILLAVDAGFTLTTDLLLKNDNYLDATVPFMLLYGPFLYLSVTDIQKKQKLHISLQFIVPLAVWIWFLIVVLAKDRSQLMMLSQYKNALGITSIFYYAFFTILRRNQIKSQFLKRRHYLIFSGMLLLIAAMPLLIHLLNYPVTERQNLTIVLIRIQIYSVMLAGSVFVLVIQLLSKKNKQKLRHGMPEQIKLSYKYSGLQDEQLEVIFKQLSIGMQQHQAFLKPQLSLDILAKNLKIPAHHLTYVFTAIIGKNYYDYIAELRINYAIELIHNSPLLSLTEIMNASGYSSSATFYRQFKKITKKTPRQFIKVQPIDNLPPQQ